MIKSLAEIHIFIHALIHSFTRSFTKYLLNAYYVLGTIPGTGDTLSNMMDDVPSLRKFKLMGGGEEREQSTNNTEINEIIPESAVKKIKGPGL